MYSNRDKLFLILVSSSLVSGLIILFSMSNFYIHSFFTLMYAIIFLLGIFFGSICLSLSLWKKTSPILVTSFLTLFLSLNYFLFPFAHSYYPYFNIVRICLLCCIFIIALLSFILFKCFYTQDKNNLLLPLSLFLWVISILTLCIQIYVKIPFISFLLTYFLLSLSILVLLKKWTHNLIILIFCICMFLISFVFYKMNFFLITTPQDNQARIFELGNQIDFKTAINTDKSLLDIAKDYTGNLPTHKDIYTNGRYYGHLIGNEEKLDYASKTPYSVLYALKDSPKVLILNSAGGGDVYLTHMLINGNIDALEQNQEVLNQIRDKESLYIGGIYHNRNTLFYRSSIRSYISSTDKTYDMITLNYSILTPNDLLYLSEGEQQLSVEAFQDYFKLLNPQGVLFLSLQTFQKDFNQALALKIINTFSVMMHLSSEELLKRIHIFETEYSLGLILSKQEFSTDQENLYNEKLKSLDYQSIIPNNQTSILYQNINSLLKQDKNETSKIFIDLDPIRDSQNNWFFQIANDLHLWGDSLFGFLFMHYFLIISISLGFLFILYTLFGFKKTNLYKMRLGNFFSYFLCLGLVLGLGLVFGLNFLNYTLTSNFITIGWFLSSLIFSFFISQFIFYFIPQVYRRIHFSFLSQSIINISFLLCFQLLEGYFVSLSLIWRIIISVFIISGLYIFMLIPVFSGFAWVNYMQAKQSSFLRNTFLLGLMFGTSFGAYLLFYVSSIWILSINILLLLLGYLFLIFLDKRSKEIDYLYSKERI